jgi:carboxypeptidase PM20D1
MLRALAPAVAPPARWLLSCPRPLEPLVRALLALAPETNALVRTTVAATVIAAGVKENVLPDTARATLDVRVIPGDGVEGRPDSHWRTTGRVAARTAEPSAV